MPFEINHHSNRHSYAKRIGREKDKSSSSFSWKQLGHETFYGGFSDEPATVEGTATSVLIGFIPIVGQVADARDTVAAIRTVILQPSSVGAWAALVLALACWIPGVDLLKPLKKGKTSNRTNNIFADLSEQEIESALGKMTSSGELLNDLIPHNKATRTRKALGLSGQDYQSMHIAPRSSMRNVDGYNPNITLTRLGRKDIHKRWDKIWKDEFQSAKYDRIDSIKAKHLYEVVSRAISKSPDFSTGEKASMIARLWDEIFIEAGLRSSDMVRRPYFSKKIGF